MYTIIEKIFLLDRKYKIAIQLFSDSLLIILILLLSMYLRLDELNFLFKIDIWITLLITVPSTLIAFFKLGFYRTIIRYISNQVLKTVFCGIGFSAWIMLFGSQIINLEIPRSVPVIYFTFMVISITGIRFALSIIYQQWKNQKPKLVAIYGAGSSGRQLLNFLRNSNEYKPVVFFDDSNLLAHTDIMGLQVHPFKNAKSLINKYKISTILLAMPGISSSTRQSIIGKIQKFKLEMKSIPNLFDIINGKTQINELRNVTIEEILERETVIPKQKLLKPNIKDKTVLVTGAGGSIGSELCRQIILTKPQKLILLDKSEHNLYKINLEIEKIFTKKKHKTIIIPILALVQDENRIFEVLRKFKVDTIYHAAAYKHVPLLEQNVIEGIKNNIIGTNILTNLAIKLKIKNFILISTDKAVRPTNYMGASKRIAEIICQSCSLKQKHTKFCIVRFGNVMGSSGSVIPLFKKQIASGGPITVTNESIERFFMTITEAAQLVIQAGSMSKGGEIYILDMGKPVNILELAKKMCYLHGLNPYLKKSLNNYGNIKIKIIGLRPGEKIREELTKNNYLMKTEHSRIFEAKEEFLYNKNLDKKISTIKDACQKNNLKKIKFILNQLDADIKLSKKSYDLIL